MTDMTVQVPGLAGAAPVYTAVTASDRFLATPGARYMIHYKNGATLTGAGSFKMGDPTTPIPAASAAAGGFADAVLQNTGMAATTELISVIDNATRFRDATGWINLTHTGTLTTVSVAIMKLP